MLLLKIDPFVNSIKLIFSYIFNPSFSSKTISEFGNVKENVLNLLKTEIKIKELIEENRRLKSEMILLENYKSENKRLYELIGLKKSFNYNGRFAKVISLNSKKPYSFVFIDKGLKDGISLYNPVLAYLNKQWIIIGRIFEVYNGYSKVMLITNSNFSFIGDTYNSRGLLIGNSSRNISYKYIDGNIKLGDDVFTSRVSMIFPPLVKVGKIVEVDFNKDQISTVATVSTFDLKDLDFVYVIDFKPYKEYELDI